MRRIGPTSIVVGALLAALLAYIAHGWIGERWHCAWASPGRAICYPERAQCEADRWADDGCEARWRVHCVYDGGGQLACLPTSEMCEEWAGFGEDCRAR